MSDDKRTERCPTCGSTERATRLVVDFEEERCFGERCGDSWHSEAEPAPVPQAEDGRHEDDCTCKGCRPEPAPVPQPPAIERIVPFCSNNCILPTGHPGECLPVEPASEASAPPEEDRIDKFLREFDLQGNDEARVEAICLCSSFYQQGHFEANADLRVELERVKAENCILQEQLEDAVDCLLDTLTRPQVENMLLDAAQRAELAEARKEREEKP